MQSITLNIQDSIYDKIIYFLQNLPKNEVEIIKHSHDEKCDNFDLEAKKLKKLFANSSNKTVLNMDIATDTTKMCDDIS